MSGRPWLFVMAGGAGTRFWPRSRASQPKQLLPIAGEDPLLVTTLKRFQGMVSEDQMVVITTRSLEASVKETLSGMPKVHVLAEPMSKNTAPSLAMAMEWLRARDERAEVMVVPADHWITDVSEYIAVMKSAVECAREQASLCTIGIQPLRPETGYGYIRVGKPIGERAYQVDRFVEKPKREVAETMLQSTEYLWNAGMFVWSVPVFFEELQKTSPELAAAFGKYRQSLKQGDGRAQVVAMDHAFADAPSISIDYALLEKSSRVVVIPGSSFGWNDLGSFLSLEEVLPKVEGGVAKAKQVIAIDSLANIVDVPGKTVALLGVTNMILVDTGDVILLAAKEQAQDVKKIVERLRAEGKKELL